MNGTVSSTPSKEFMDLLKTMTDDNAAEVSEKIKALREAKENDAKQDVNLKADEVMLPFAGLCELLQQVIINILVKSFNFSYSDAYKKWYRCQITGKDQTIYDIIDGLIKDSDGLPVVIK